MKRKYYVFLMINVITVIVLMSCSNSSAGGNSNSKTDSESTPTESRSLDIAFAADNDLEMKLMSAEDYDVSEEEKEYTIHLREGVQFHEGTTVEAEEAIASMERWRKVSGVGKITDEYIDSIAEEDELTFTMKLNEVYSSLLSDLAASKSSMTVMPADIAEEACEKPLEQDQLIGTGPYKFKEWDRGEEIVLERFDDYAARDEEDWGGLTGKKEAYF